MIQQLIDFLQKNIEHKLDYEKLLEKPKFEDHGDIALPVFILSKELKQNPVMIAKELETKLKQSQPDFIENIEAAGPFLNFHFNNALVAEETLTNIKSEKILKINTKNPQKILLEYPSPNTNKALHLGHLRNLLLGNSLKKIFNKTGHKTITINLNNDKGIAICKAMISYQLWGENKTPQTENIKPDKFVANYYVLYEKKNKAHPELNLDEKAQDMLLRWEEGDKEIIALWKKLLNWVYEGYAVTLKNFKYQSDKDFFESQIYDKGKEIVLKGLEQNIFQKDETGAVYCDLTDIKLDKKYLLRKDGTTLYMTQDIYLAQLKQKQYKADKYIFIVANEQIYHFKVLFEILDRLGIADTKKNYHLAYGYVTLPEGKMKSREGTVVEADELLEEVTVQARENLKQRDHKLNEKELEQRAKTIAYAALSFFILKYNPMQDFVFNPKESLSFEGETGPYVQYTYARIRSVLKKADEKINWKKIDYGTYSKTEISLIKKLKEYPEIIKEASEKYKPSHIANYLVKVCQLYNEFYQNSPILKEKEEIRNARLALCHSTAVIIKDGLSLLDIDALEQM